MNPRIWWLWVRFRLVLRPTVDGLQSTDWRRNRPASHEVFQSARLLVALARRVDWPDSMPLEDGQPAVGLAARDSLPKRTQMD